MSHLRCLYTYTEAATLDDALIRNVAWICIKKKTDVTGARDTIVSVTSGLNSEQ